MMTKRILFGGGFLLAVGALLAFTLPKAGIGQAAQANDTIKWYTWEEAMLAMEKEPKKVFIDVYTDWCGWCKRMDASTFTDPGVIKEMNKHFYAVKFNAEQEGDIEYKGKVLKYQANAGRRGVHQLAYALLDGRLGYPSFVYLDEKQDRITISPGYKTPDVLVRELGYVAGGHYKTMKFEEYKGE
jgi:thioredoxin-related protein